MRLVAWVVLSAAALGACAPAVLSPRSDAEVRAQRFEEALEVDNATAVPVTIRYYTNSGGPFTLDVVEPHRREQLVLPNAEVGHVFAESPSGQRLPGGPGARVYIRRVTLD